LIKKTNYYVTNRDLYDEIVKYKETGIMSQELGKMLLLVANKYSSKGNFAGYTWRQDMVSEAIFTCVKYLKNFNPEKSTNAFAYVTQIIKNSFIVYINEQKKHSKIKDMCYKGYETYKEENTKDMMSDISLNYTDIMFFSKESVEN